ncbi:uncharacterized protein LOC131150848 isoform X2 [Malania oleifera]|uniref:uncharacterized protein LOC131150848 isoform X2 n=1 Tax=Malania oleifera TaxID=397392 RepID=UPI0025AE9CCA|nr:uncharacterized protein LOC131150848 isoform X2 [Malania oleifera]
MHLTPISILWHLERSVASCLSLTRLLQIAEIEDERIVREFAELLDAHEASLNMSGEETDEGECQKKLPTQKISERFMGMRAAIITNNLHLKSFGGKLGYTILQLGELKDNICLTEQPLDIMASELLKCLGFLEGKALETNQFDLVIVHFGESTNNEKDTTNTNGVECINGLVGEIMQLARPGSEIGSRLHLSVVMSYRDVLKEDEYYFSVLADKSGKDPDLSLLFPRQSYTLKAGNLRTNTRHYCPMLIAQWQDAVTRMDEAKTFSFKEFKEKGGILTIPADRFLHEVAFKLWKAPKYGA